MKKFVYKFEEGNGKMRELLGGKGANLAEMTVLGLPVPPGFTVTTEACTQYYNDGRKITPVSHTTLTAVSYRCFPTSLWNRTRRFTSVYSTL